MCIFVDDMADADDDSAAATAAAGGVPIDEQNSSDSSDSSESAAVAPRCLAYPRYGPVPPGLSGPAIPRHRTGDRRRPARATRKRTYVQTHRAFFP